MVVSKIHLTLEVTVVLAYGRLAKRSFCLINVLPFLGWVEMPDLRNFHVHPGARCCTHEFTPPPAILSQFRRTKTANENAWVLNCAHNFVHIQRCQLPRIFNASNLAHGITRVSSMIYIVPSVHALTVYAVFVCPQLGSCPLWRPKLFSTVSFEKTMMATASALPCRFGSG